MRHFLRGQAAEIFVDEGKQLLRGLSVTLLNGFEDLGDIGHPVRLSEWDWIARLGRRIPPGRRNAEFSEGEVWAFD